jgi:diguanylate cyclase (GGDEF)-like protein/PAS domain S-box-containing protein
MPDGRTDEVEGIRATMDALLARPGEVLVGALDEQVRFVPLPDVLAHHATRELVTDLVLDLFVPEDWSLAIELWRAACRDGAARGTVHLVGPPEHEATLLIGDYRDRYGVFLTLLTGDGVDEADLSPASAERAVARVCQLRQDDSGGILDVDDGVTSMLGWRREELVGRSAAELVHPDDFPTMLQAWVGAVTGDRPRQARLRRKRSDGSWLWVETTYTNHLRGPDPHVATEMVDIQREMAAVEALEERELLLRRLTEALPVGIVQVDRTGAVVYGNDRAWSLLGIDGGHTLTAVVRHVTPASRRAVEEALRSVLAAGPDRDLEVDVLPSPGTVRRCLVSIRALAASPGAVTGAIVCLTDVTAEVDLRRQLEDRATYDALTRCHNRDSVLSTLGTRLARGDGARVAVAFIDVDGFKPVNDRWGHAAGDQLLGAVAARLRGALRGDDVVGRLGGDEFLVVCGVQGRPDDLVAVADRLGATFATPVPVAGSPLRVRASIGVARGDQRIDADELVRRADVAMYAAKRAGGGAHRVYDPSLEGERPAPEVVVVTDPAPAVR